MIYLLIWVLCGLLGLNLMWMATWLIEHPDYKIKHVLKGFFFGILLGPFAILGILKKIKKNKHLLKRAKEK